MADTLGCHSRTVYRDLEALQFAGFPIYTEKVDGKSLWSLLDSAKHSIPIPFNLAELMALYFCRGMMKTLKNTAFYDSLESLFDKIRTTLPREYIQYLGQFEKSVAVVPQPYKQHGRIRDIVEAITRATVEHKYIEIDYYTMSRKKKSRRKVAPYRIWFFNGTFYLIADCGLRGDVRIFALDRIQALKTTEETYEMPEDFNLDDFMRASFGIFHGESVAVRIWFDSELAGYIREKTWHATQRIETLKDGSIIFEAEVAGTTEIKSWILSWGSRAVVLSPDSLRMDICAELQALLKNYEDIPDQI
jgi:predicted DNA-binding transcriptional regulator YafY